MSQAPAVMEAAALAPDTGRTFGRPMRTPVLYGMAIASVGGPLALVSLLLPGTVVRVRSSAGLVALLGGLAFAFPVLVWYRYASTIASAGGLYAFVQAAAGRRIAAVHAGMWIISYFLYLPFTVVYAIYDVIPVAFPGVAPYRGLLDVAVPVAIVASLVAWRLALYALVAVLGTLQVLLVLIVAGLQLAGPGGPTSAFPLHAPAGVAAQSVVLVSLLFICLSLVPYFGAEVRRPRVSTARALPIGLGIGVGCAVLGVLALDRLPASALGGEVPGWLMARAVGGTALGDAVVILSALSVLGLVVLEYVALTRLLSVMTPIRPRRAELGVGAAFVAASALSLIDPSGAYSDLVMPALVALYASQLVPIVAFPRFRWRMGQLRASDLVASTVATGLMGYGLYLSLQQAIGF